VIGKLWKKFLLRFVFEDPEKCEHEWEVWGTATAQVCLELHCRKCALLGSVNDPTEEEWKQAFDAAENPYLWKDNSRAVKGNKQFI